MSHEPTSAGAVPIARIFLNLKNPRFKEKHSEAEVIKHLCENDQIYALASDMVEKQSLNPMDRVGLIPLGAEKKRENYTVVEGNRRICALKLLLDPDLAPPPLVKKFEALAEKWESVDTIPAEIFKDEDDARPWLERMHEGLKGGIGRKSWNAEQQQRFSGGNKNRPALGILDYCQKMGYITEEQRQGKLTTVQRFVGNNVFREHIGIDTTDPENIKRTRPEEDFNLLIKTFITDLLEDAPPEKKKVSSRMNKAKIDAYARQVSSAADISNERPDPESLTATATAKKTRKRKKPKKVKRASVLEYEIEISDKIKELGSQKLEHLYYSLSNIELKDHTVLVSIGLWAFLESLTATAGRAGKDFSAFLSYGQLTKYGITEKADKKSITEAIKRISSYGNESKHHAIAATYNGDQLNSDWILIKPVILACIEDAISQKK